MDQHKPERLLRPAGGTAVAPSTGSMRLCAGTLVVDQPDQVLLDDGTGYNVTGLSTEALAEIVWLVSRRSTTERYWLSC